MKRFTVLFAAALFFSTQAASAATRADSILAFTGGRQVVAAWLRLVWCDANYNPIQAQASDPNKYNRVMVLNTAEPGGARCLDSTVGQKGMPFPNRKDGKYIIYNGKTSSGADCAYIIASDGKSPRRDLNLGAEFNVLSTQFNPATGEEFIYVMGTGQTAIYRIPLKADYTADLSRKTQVIFQSEFASGAGQADGAFSVSADGTKAGCALPWPETRIVDIPSKTVYSRHQGMFGCNCNLAPDNSYRFFHFGDDHDLIHMWAANLSDSWWDVSFSNVPLNANIGQQWPRWTSNVNFMTIESPLRADTPDNWTFENNAQYSWSADKVKQMPANLIGHFYLGKFSADFKSLTWTLLAGDNDPRVDEADRGGMAYVSADPVSVIPGRSHLSISNSKSGLAAIVKGDRLEVTFSTNEPGTVSLISPAGRVVARASGRGRMVCAIGSQPAGTYIARVTAGTGVYSTRVLIGR